MKKTFFAALFFSALGWTSCNKGNTLPKDKPLIGFVSAAPFRVLASPASEDTLHITFTIKDGKANIGNSTIGAGYDIFIYDMRDTSLFAERFFPAIPEQYRDPAKGIEATCITSIPASYIPRRTSHPSIDTVEYEIFIKDRDGVESNRIRTSSIYLDIR